MKADKNRNLTPGKTGKSLWLLILAVLSLLTMGCAEKMTAKEILERVNERYQSISSYKATVSLEDVSEGKVHRTMIAVAFKKPDRFREERAKSVSVINGTTWWLYNKTSGEVTKVDLSMPPPYPDFYYGLFLEMVRNYSVTLEGEEKILGKDCYLLNFTSPNKTPSPIRMWIVKGQWYPVRIEMKVEMEFPRELRERYHVSNFSSVAAIEFREIKFNAEIDDTEFEAPVINVEERPLIEGPIEKPTLKEVKIFRNHTLLHGEERNRAVSTALSYIRGKYGNLSYSIPHAYRHHDLAKGKEMLEVYVVPDGSSTAYVVFIDNWRVKEVKKIPYRGFGDFEVNLSVDSNESEPEGKITLCAELTYKGSLPRLIYHRHIHPLRIEVSRNGKVVARLPSVILDVLRITEMNPSEKIRFCDSLKLSRGAYKAVAYAELAFDEVAGCEECYRKIYSNPVAFEI